MRSDSHPRLLHDLLERSASRLPEKTAIVHGERRLTYRKLASGSAEVASILRSRGVASGDRVAVLLPRSPAEILAFFGASMAGCAFVPINPLLKVPQVNHILNDSGARILLATSELADPIREAMTEGSPELVLLDLDDSAGPPTTTRIRGPSVGGRTAGNAARSPSDLAALIYTSGSTGPAKGVMVTHGNLLAGSRIATEYLRIGEDERILCVLPFSFDYGLNQAITAIECGATSVLLDFHFGHEVLDALEAERITGLAGVPTFWTLLTRSGLSRRALPRLRYITNSGGALPATTLEHLRAALPHVDFFLMYGFTEAFRSTYLPPSELVARPTSIGRAVPETEILVLREDGSECDPHETGMIVHHGPTVSLGYWRRPEDTARLLRPHPDPRRVEPASAEAPLVCWSGDLARRDEEGFHYFVGRADARIKSAGYRVSPTEIEAVLIATGLVSEAAVVGLPDPVLGERPYAIAVPRGARPPAVADLLARASRELPDHMLPRDVEWVGALPTLSNGKVDYAAIREARLPPGGVS